MTKTWDWDIVTGVPGTMDRGTTNRERERRFRCSFYSVGAISFPRSRPERSFPERGTLHRSRSAVTKDWERHVAELASDQI